MKSFPLFAACVLPIGTTSARAADSPPSRDMLLWYRQPAANWLQALPMGNGLIGAMVFGGVQRERIALNEGTFWSGRPHDYDNPEAIKYFPQIRDLVFAGKFQEAEKLADAHFFGVPVAQQAFQPLGDLNLSFEGVEKTDAYRRELDLESGVATTTYRAQGATITREIFVSYPDRVMVVRIASNKPGRVSVRAELKSPYLDSVTAKPGTRMMDGQWKGPIPVKNPLIAPVEGKGIGFRVALAARAEGGRTEADGDALRIRGADAVTLIVSAATSFVNYHDIGGDPIAACEKTLAGCENTDYSALRRRHVEDFRALMGRVQLTVGDKARNDTPTDERLASYRQQHDDPNLEAQCFQFGRYLLISSSRAGGQPANLQGIWNESISPSWGSKYTININTQMNYWPAEVCNLPECHQPLFDMLEDISVTGAKTAKIYYGRDGWVVHHNIDLWRGTAPVDAARYGMWPVGGAWLCQHLWEHYAFTGDQAFLKKYYPILRGSAQFLLGLLIEEPRHHWLVTPFSMSPEHGYYDADGNLAFLSPGPTLDIALMPQLFPHCIEASKLLGVDADFREKLAAALEKLPPYRINERGYLQEWIEDWKPGNQGHNVSPDFAFYPGSSVTLRGTPQLAAAVEKWMSSRRPRGGFPTAWGIAMWARLENGEQVAQWTQTFIASAMADNLHNRGANQSDANFGFTAAIAESLLQSHAPSIGSGQAGEINLLPALPPSWTDGAIQGLKARGGFTIAMQWTRRPLSIATVHHARGITHQHPFLKKMD